jgi:SanA protein
VYGLGLLVALLGIAINVYIVRSSSSRVFSSIELLPHKHFCLILGADPYSDAVDKRLRAAQRLYELGKVKHFILSGDNSHEAYNEPEVMKQKLILAGIPEEALTLDYAGLRTLDSVYRAKYVFGIESLCIVTQAFHSSRSLYLTKSMGIDSVAYVADKTYAEDYNQLREYLARVMAFIDVAIGRQAKFSGPAEFI